MTKEAAGVNILTGIFSDLNENGGYIEIDGNLYRYEKKNATMITVYELTITDQLILLWNEIMERINAGIRFLFYCWDSFIECVDEMFMECW